MPNPKFQINKMETLSVDKELVILNAILQYKDVDKVSKAVSATKVIVNSVLWKYRDVIAMMLANDTVSKKVQDNYEKTIDMALDANNKAISLMQRQVTILYNEYNDPANQNVLMKDYLLTQVMNIVDKMNKLVDLNNIKVKESYDILQKRIAGFTKNDFQQEENDYKDNVQSVFDKLNKTPASKMVVAINKEDNTTKIFHSVNDAGRYLSINPRDLADKARNDEIPGWIVRYETKDSGGIMKKKSNITTYIIAIISMVISFVLVIMAKGLENLTVDGSFEIKQIISESIHSVSFWILNTTIAIATVLVWFWSFVIKKTKRLSEKEYTDKVETFNTCLKSKGNDFITYIKEENNRRRISAYVEHIEHKIMRQEKKLSRLTSIGIFIKRDVYIQKRIDRYKSRITQEYLNQHLVN